MSNFSLSLRCALAAIVWLCLPANAAQQEHPVLLWGSMQSVDLAHQVAYLEDPGGHMTLAEAMAPYNVDRYQSATGSKGDLNLGFSKSAYWLRVRFVVAHEEPLDWLLEISYPPLDRVDVSKPALWGGYETETLGDRQPFAERSYPDYNLVVPLTLQNGKEQTVYVRVQSEGPLIVPMKIWRPAAFAQAHAVQLSWLLLYLGMLLCLMVYSGALFLVMRKSIYLKYALFAASMALAQFAYAGLGYQYLWPDWPRFAHLAPVTMLAVMGFCGCLFILDFLGTYIGPRLRRALLLSMAAFALSVVVAALYSYNLGVRMAIGAALAVWLCAMFGSLRLIKSGLPGIGYFIGSWGALSVGAIIFGLRTMGMLPSTWFTTYALQLTSAVEMALLAFSLAARVVAMRREKELLQQQALGAKEEMVAALRSNEIELEARIEDRTRALEEANRALRESEQHLQRLVRHDPLTGLANRVFLYDRMSHALSRCRRHGGTLAVLLIDLDDFKPVNDRFGHAVGDHLLMAVAARFASVVRETDTVARIGGDEFVVLLEQAATPVSTEIVANKLRAEACRPFEVSGIELRIGASVGVAIYPRDGSDIQGLLSHADSNMYANKSASKEQPPDNVIPILKA